MIPSVVLPQSIDFVPRALPIAPRPVPEETLSSWMARVAAANGITPRQLIQCALRRSRGSSPARFYVDASPPKSLVRGLAALCRLPESCVDQLDLKRQFPISNGFWFLPNDYSAETHRAGESGSPAPQPFCPGCLCEQWRRAGPPHFKAEWQFAPVTMCAQHEIFLFESCSRCRHAIPQMHFGHDGRFRLLCPACYSDASRLGLPFEPWLSRTMRLVGRLQQTIVNALRNGRVDPFWVGQVEPQQFIVTVQDLLVLLTTHDSDEFLLLADHLIPVDLRFRYPVGRTFYQPFFAALGRNHRLAILSALALILLGPRSQRQISPASIPFSQEHHGAEFDLLFDHLHPALETSALRCVERWPQPLARRARLGWISPRTPWRNSRKPPSISVY